MSVCSRCPKLLGASCCEVADDEKLATITRADAERIREHTGWAIQSFVEEEWMATDDCAAYEDRRPLYAGYFRTENVRWTLQRRDGACIFLDRSRGCRLGDARPIACKLYPFTQFADGSWSVQVSRHGSLEAAREQHEDACLAVEEAESMDEVLAAFNTSRETIEALGVQLKADAAQHGSPRRPR